MVYLVAWHGNGAGGGRLGRRLVVTWGGGIVRRQPKERPPNLWDQEGPTTQEEAGEEDKGWAAPRLRAQVEETVLLAPQTSSYTLWKEVVADSDGATKADAKRTVVTT